jgi:two-component system chemotaxis response regulator CheB
MADPTIEAEPPVIALVCSAGGLEALIEVLNPLGPTLPAAIIVLQHQIPTHSSRLAAILGRQCLLTVRDATNDDVLEAGHVLVVPPGRHALVTVAGRVALIKSDGVPPYRPSADLLFTSLALSAPRRSIAVILSGAGNDGATGATALHAFGGVVIAASRESSRNFGMPGAAIGRDEIVDYVVSVEEIPALLTRLIDRRQEAPLTQPEPV